MGKKCDLCGCRSHTYYGCGPDNIWALCGRCREHTRTGFEGNALEELLRHVTALRERLTAADALAHVVAHEALSDSALDALDAYKKAKGA